MLDPYGWFVVGKNADVQCKTWICSAKHVHVHPDGRSARAARRGPCRRKNNSGVLTWSQTTERIKPPESRTVFGNIFF